MSRSGIREVGGVEAPGEGLVDVVGRERPRQRAGRLRGRRRDLGPRSVAQEAQPHVLLVEEGQLVDKRRGKEVHEEVDLALRASPWRRRRPRGTSRPRRTLVVTASRSESTPATWPWERSRPRAVAQRPLPSIMIETCAGNPPEVDVLKGDVVRRVLVGAELFDVAEH